MRRIVITGCGGGLGEALSDAAFDAGHKVFPHYRRSDDSNVLVGNLTDWSFIDKFNECIFVPVGNFLHLDYCFVHSVYFRIANTVILRGF